MKQIVSIIIIAITFNNNDIVPPTLWASTSNLKLNYPLPSSSNLWAITKKSIIWQQPLDQCWAHSIRLEESFGSEHHVNVSQHILFPSNNLTVPSTVRHKHMCSLQRRKNTPLAQRPQTCQHRIGHPRTGRQCEENKQTYHRSLTPPFKISFHRPFPSPL